MESSVLSKTEILNLRGTTSNRAIRYRSGHGGLAPIFRDRQNPDALTPTEMALSAPDQDTEHIGGEGTTINLGDTEIDSEEDNGSHRKKRKVTCPPERNKDLVLTLLAEPTLSLPCSSPILLISYLHCRDIKDSDSVRKH